jgi:hypothetical protein
MENCLKTTSNVSLHQHIKRGTSQQAFVNLNIARNEDNLDSYFIGEIHWK